MSPHDALPGLEGKVALVTGGSRGLGQAICLELSRAGAAVAFLYRRDEEGARRTLEEMGEGRGLAFRTSVVDGPGLVRSVKEIEEALGGIQILVNSAGLLQSYPFALIEEEDWDRVMDVNVKGAFLTCRAVLRGMIRRKEGSILNIGSLAGLRALDAPVHYCTSKAALVGFTLSLAKEMSRHSIRVNCLAPGLLEGGVGKNITEARMRDYLEHCSLGRAGTLEEVARLAAFLVSDRNTFMNGEVVVPDGGL